MMRQLVGGSERLDDELMEELRPKIQAGTLTGEELERAFRLFGQVLNATEEIQYEISGMTQAFQFHLDEDSYAVVFTDGICEVYSGVWPTPTVIFFISVRTVLRIITGQIHSSVAQMNGDIKYTGPRHDAIAFQRIFELILDEFI